MYISCFGVSTPEQSHGMNKWDPLRTHTLNHQQKYLEVDVMSGTFVKCLFLVLTVHQEK